MVRQRGSAEITTRKKPAHAFSFMSIGSRTHGWDSNLPTKEDPYYIFGKRMRRSILGFGSLATAFYSRKLISEAVLYKTHGTLNPSKSNVQYFHARFKHHKEQSTTEYKTMRRAVRVLLTRFPSMEDDAGQANKDSQPLTTKIRKIMQGANAARNTDTNSIKREIFALSQDDAKNRGWSMPTTIGKNNRGIKSESTALFLLPFIEREKYLQDPKVYREGVERGQIKISLSGTWPAIFYDETMVEDDDELTGLFRSETLLRCAITVLCGPSAGTAWEYPQPGARSFAASLKESNAEINEIKEVTPETIAYISTLVVFAIHDSIQFNRDMGGIDLSEVYHDIVSVLRTKTGWAAETLEFWNSIIFGDREEEEPEQGISREDRMRKLEAKQREKEGRAPLGADTDKPQAPPVASPGTSNRSGQDTNGTRSPMLNPTDKSQTSRSGQPASRPKGAPSKGNTLKRTISNPDSDAESDDESGKGSPPQRKRIRRRTSSPVDDDPPATEEQTTSASSTSVNFVSAEEWEGVCEVLKKSIKQAKAIDRKRLAAQFAKLLRMDTEEAILKYNENFDDMQTAIRQVEVEYESQQAASKVQGPTPPSRESTQPENQASTSKPSKQPQAKPTAKNKGGTRKTQKAPVVTQGTSQVMPPPSNITRRKVTRSVTAQLSRQNAQKNKNDFNFDDDEDLTDLEETTAPTPKAKEKLPVNLTPRRNR